MSEKSEAEIAWRQRLLDELTRNRGLSAAEAQVIIEREAFWRPWEPVTARFPTLKNLDRYRSR